MAISLKTISAGLERGVNKVANSKFMKSCFSERAGEMAATIALWSTTTKDAVNCYYYTNQSLHNKKIPEENRKFVAAIDLSNGFLNVASQLTLGAYIKNKLPNAFDKLFKNSSLKGGTRAAAKNGFILLGTLIFAQIILKRVLTPFLATPMAHYIKEYGEKKVSAKKTSNEGAETPSVQSKLIEQGQKLNVVSDKDSNNLTFKSFENMLK